MIDRVALDRIWTGVFTGIICHACNCQSAVRWRYRIMQPVQELYEQQSRTCIITQWEEKEEMEYVIGM